MCQVFRQVSFLILMSCCDLAGSHISKQTSRTGPCTMSSLVGCHNISLCKCEHVALRSSYSHTYMGDGCLLIGLLPSVTPVSHCKLKQRVFFSAPMLTDESVHTAGRGGAAARSRSRAGAAVTRSFRRRVYFCCAAYAQLK